QVVIGGALGQRLECVAEARERATVDRIVDGLPHPSIAKQLSVCVEVKVVQLRHRVDEILLPSPRSGGAPGSVASSELLGEACDVAGTTPDRRVIGAAGLHLSHGPAG